MKSNRVDFTEEDVQYARIIGGRIRDVSCELGLKEKSVVHNQQYNPHQDFIGALGEMLLARYLDIPFVPNICTFKRPDILNLQSRATDAIFNGCLIIRPDDPADHPYVLTTIDLQYKRGFVKGWIWGYEAMVPEKWYEGEAMARRLQPGDPAWLVEQTDPDMHSLDTLPIEEHYVDRAAAE